MSKINNLYGLHYLKFLSLVQAVRALPSFPSLDPVEERLLNLFATVWHTGQKITVLQAMGMAVDMSSTTAHRRLKTLRQKGVINLEMDAADNRIKYVVATPVVDQYFARLGECVGLACVSETVTDPS